MSLNCDDVDNGSENGVEFYLFLPGFAAGRHATYDWSVVGPINKSRSLPVDCRLFFYFRFLAPPPLARSQWRRVLPVFFWVLPGFLHPKSAWIIIWT